MNCKDCIHSECCFMQYGEELSEKWQDENGCKNFKDRSRYVKLKTTLWCKHTPDKNVMRKFHEDGIGTGMSEDSVFWTCANCGVWGSPIYKYCPHCGAKVEKPSRR